MKCLIAVLFLGGCAATRGAPPDMAALPTGEVPGICTMEQAAANLERAGEVPLGVAQSYDGHALVLFTDPDGSWTLAMQPVKDCIRAVDSGPPGSWRPAEPLR